MRAALLRALLVAVAMTACVGEEVGEVCNGLDDDGDGVADNLACPESYPCLDPDRCVCRGGYQRCGWTCASVTSRLRTCNGLCTNIDTDPIHCGACNHRCGSTRRCVAGVCEGQPLPREALCAGQVVNLIVDSSNCGACGYVCPSGTECRTRVCQCRTGFSACSTVCVDTQNDPQNCGACGRRCAEGEPCVRGVCACAAGRTRCGAECVDVTRSVRHCGACDRPCAFNATCFEGACLCQTGLTHCAGQCVTLDDSPAHCGACGARCAGAGQRCEAGVCRCENGLTPCGDACVDTQTDAAHCGACGMACPAGRSCASGGCTPLPRSPGAGARLGAPRPSFRWDTGEATVEVCRDRECGDIVARASGTAEAGATLTADLAPGSYFWRVVRPGQTRAATRNLVIDARRSRLPGLLPPSLDLDGDGRADVVALSAVDARAYALRAGVDAPTRLSRLDFMWRSPSRGLLRASGDLDGDGRVDAAFNLGGRMYVTRYSPSAALEFTGWPRLGDTLPLADLDREGTVDLAEVVDGRPRVFYGADSAMSFTLDGVVGRHDALAPAGDVDGDGVDDVLIAAPSSTPPRAYVYFGSSAGLDRSRLLPPPPRSAGYGAWVAPAGDVNGDGHADLLVAMGVSGGAVYLGGADAITLHRAITSTDGDDLRVFAAGDMDGDGFYDLLAVPAARGEVRLYRGSVTGLASEPLVLRDARFAAVETAGAMGDRDGDGLDDVVLGAPASDLVLILYGVRGAAPSRVTEIGGDPGTEFGRAVL